MTDNDVWVILTAMLDSAIVSSGLDASNVIFARAVQPRQEGAISQPALYCHRISSKRYGWQSRKDNYNSTDDNFDHTESIITESVYQVSAEVSEDPNDLSELTAFDVVSRIALQLNSYAVRQFLLSNDIAIIRIIDVRTPFFKNESDQFEPEPSFDFTISYKQNIMSKVSSITEYEGNISRV